MKEEIIEGLVKSVIIVLFVLSFKYILAFMILAFLCFLYGLFVSIF